LDEFKKIAEKGGIKEDKVYKATILLFIKKYYKMTDNEEIIKFFNNHTTEPDRKIQSDAKYIQLLNNYKPEPEPQTTGGKKKKRMTRKIKKFINLLLKI
jgi:hypothetical protein